MQKLSAGIVLVRLVVARSKSMCVEFVDWIVEKGLGFHLKELVELMRWVRKLPTRLRTVACVVLRKQGRLASN